MSAQRDHLGAFVRAYGEENVIPKHHSAYHVAKKYAEKPYLPDSLVLERKHKKAKAFADSHRSYGNYEEFVLFSCLVDQRRMLLQDRLQDGFVGAQGSIVQQVRYKGATFSVNDVVWLEGGCVAKITRICTIDGKYALVCKKMMLRRRLAPGASEFAFSHDVVAFDLARRGDVQTAFCWSHQEDSTVLTLHSISWVV